MIAIFSEKERQIQEIEKIEIKPKATFTQDDDLLMDLDLENAIPESQYVIKTAKLITSFEPVFPSLISKQTHQGQIEYDNQWQQVLFSRILLYDRVLKRLLRQVLLLQW